MLEAGVANPISCDINGKWPAPPFCTELECTVTVGAATMLTKLQSAAGSSACCFQAKDDRKCNGDEYCMGVMLSHKSSMCVADMTPDMASGYEGTKKLLSALKSLQMLSYWDFYFSASAAFLATVLLYARSKKDRIMLLRLVAILIILLELGDIVIGSFVLAKVQSSGALAIVDKLFRAKCFSRLGDREVLAIESQLSSFRTITWLEVGGDVVVSHTDLRTTRTA
jgi:hypothetical protein